MIEQQKIWERNLERLKAGEFGAHNITEPGHEHALLAYWKAQADAGYPYAESNVRYFESIIAHKKSSVDPNTRTKLLVAQLRVIALTLTSKYCRDILIEAAQRLEDTDKIATFFRNKQETLLEEIHEHT